VEEKTMTDKERQIEDIARVICDGCTEELNCILYCLPISWGNFKGTKECPKTKGDHNG
jgi:hypothetical protein